MSRTSSTFGRLTTSRGLNSSMEVPSHSFQRSRLVTESAPMSVMHGGKWGSRREHPSPSRHPVSGSMSPDELFRRSLRSPTAPGSLGLYTASRGSMLDAGMSGSLRRSGSASNLRKSNPNLAASFNGNASGKSKQNSVELERIESEYIKNLQQQVYFLELESNFLREQARKATEMHPQMTTEAERMLHKLRMMQSENDNLQLEMRRKDGTVELVSQDKERIVAKMKAEEENRQREKRLLLDEVVQVKKEKDLLERDNKRKEHLIRQAQEEITKAHQATRDVETRFQVIRNQVDLKSDEQRLTQQALEEKRSELLHTETKLREMEEKYFCSTSSLQDKVSDDLRDEIRTLRQKVKEAEMAAEQDRFLRNKLSEDSSHLVKENALLNQQVVELTKQSDRERGLREGQDNRRAHSISEMVVLKEREKQLQLELAQSRELLKHEQKRCQDLIEQLSQQGHVTISNELGATTLRSRLAELEALYGQSDTENTQLRRDKMLLVDHVANLQRQIGEKEKEVNSLRSHLRHDEAELKEIDHYKDLEMTLQSQKWDEFARLADSMKSLSQSMAVRNSPRSSKQVLDFA